MNEPLRHPMTDVERLLEERARLLARRPPEEKDAAESLNLVTFQSGQERYGVEMAWVREVQPLDRSTWSRVPCTPDFIVGAVNLRGRIYSVVDVAVFLGLPARPLSETAHVLLVRGGGPEGEWVPELGLLADDRPEVIRAPQTELRRADETLSRPAQEYVRGITDDLLMVLDLEPLLADPRLLVQEEV